jgi:DNA-binding ferritin-like protein (Dps family)
VWWRAHLARVKALPPDYQIVYKEIQRYFFKLGPIDLPDGPLLPGLVDFFEEVPPLARESCNSPAPTSPPSATTCSRALR